MIIRLISGIVSDRRCKQSNNKYNDSSLFCQLYCHASLKLISNVRSGKVREKCAEKVREGQGIQIELTGGIPVTGKFFSGKKIFFPTDQPWKILESYRKRQYYFVPPNILCLGFCEHIDTSLLFVICLLSHVCGHWLYKWMIYRKWISICSMKYTMDCLLNALHQPLECS